MQIMKIRFDEMEVTVLPQFKGGEKEFAANMFFDGTNRIFRGTLVPGATNRIFRGTLVPGATIGMHTHDDSCEVIFILEGNGTIVEMAPQLQSQDHSSQELPTQSDEVVIPVSAGDCLYCPKGHSHSLRNTAEEGHLVFYAVVPKQ